MATDTQKDAPCFIPRGMPCQVSDPADEILKGLEQLSVKDNIKDRTVTENVEQPSVSPLDFVALQGARSSAFARKTNTTQMFSRGGRGSLSLFDDLINKTDTKDEKKPDENITKIENDEKKTEKTGSDAENEKEEKEDSEKSETEEKVFLSRGPAPRTKQTYNDGYHPYQQHMKMTFGAAAVTPVHDFTAFSHCGGGYEVGNSYINSPEGYISSSSTPDTVLYDQAGYAPYPSPPIGHMNCGKGNDRQLPDELSDFILNNSMSMNKGISPACSKHDGQESPSADSGVDSPLSARSAPNASPEVPQGSSSGPTTPSFNQSRLSPRSGSRGECTEAKDALRALIDEQDFVNAWYWAIKCLEQTQQTQNNDIIHVVTAHNNLAKIYALVQNMRKTEEGRDRPLFDRPDKQNYTPLYFAVINRSAPVVAYLLEAGASPNIQTREGERDTALHFAANHGMVEITKALTSVPGVQLETENARNLTPLLSAIRWHKKRESEQTTIDNKPTVALLLSAGANPRCVDALGKTIFHYAVESMDPLMVELLWKSIDSDTVTELVNLADRAGETPMHLVVSDPAKADMVMPLLSCGANMR